MGSWRRKNWSSPPKQFPKILLAASVTQCGYSKAISLFMKFTYISITIDHISNYNAIAGNRILIWICFPVLIQDNLYQCWDWTVSFPASPIIRRDAWDNPTCLHPYNNCPLVFKWHSWAHYGFYAMMESCILILPSLSGEKEQNHYSHWNFCGSGEIIIVFCSFVSADDIFLWWVSWPSKVVAFNLQSILSGTVRAVSFLSFHHLNFFFLSESCLPLKEAGKC